MNTTSKDLQERDEKYRVIAMMMNHNGHFAYQVFTGKPLEHPIKIDAISWPIGGMPSAVGFVNEDLVNQESSNDVDNPDGSAAPKPLEPMVAQVAAPPPPPPKKKNHLKVVK